MTQAEARAIAADTLRHVGLEAEARSIEDPVRFELEQLLLRIDWFERDYDDVSCLACGTYNDEHNEDCFVLHAWKYVEHPRYSLHNFHRGQRIAAERERAERAAAYKANPCQQFDSGGARCLEINGHAGYHRFPLGLARMNDVLKALYPVERINAAVYDRSLFGVDRSADPVRLTGIVHMPTEEEIVQALTPPSPQMRVIESPFVKQGDAFMFNNTLTVAPGDQRSFVEGSPADAIRKAKEALERMGKK